MQPMLVVVNMAKNPAFLKLVAAPFLIRLNISKEGIIATMAMQIEHSILWEFAVINRRDSSGKSSCAAINDIVIANKKLGIFINIFFWWQSG